MFSADELRQRLEELTPQAARGYVLALSGGADSMALTVAAVMLRDSGWGLPLRAVHVDHGLQASAGRFREACELICARLRLPLSVLALDGAPAPGKSVEEWAREARYAALGADLGADECLLTAHNSEDQAETFLLQALRGAGLAGLAAMPSRREFGNGWHLRPLLAVARQSLRAFVMGQEVEALEDAMNRDPRFDRAYLRQTVWPLLASRWPAAAEVLGRAAAHLAEAHAGRQAGIARDLQCIRDGDALSLPALRRLTGPRQRDVLRAFIVSRGARMPPRARLHEALRQMHQARADAAPAIAWGTWVLRRHRDRVHLTPSTLPSLGSHDWNWRDSCLELGGVLGPLQMVPHQGGLDMRRLPHPLHIRSRADAGDLRITCGGHARLVRSLFQEAGILPWLRDCVPLVSAQGRLIAVGHRWRAEDWCVEPGGAGLAIRWQQGPSLF
ncbi:MAG: tRNA lysidine(34) synthetase TilS [Proteobacteria bacterium]|nr:tRNA lysidine(34) synthetase TilS [Pseudomonadota bacterium]